MNEMRTGRLPVIKNTAWDCPRCPFFDMCVLDEKNPRAAREYQALNYTEYDPYADHRKSAGELWMMMKMATAPLFKMLRRHFMNYSWLTSPQGSLLSRQSTSVQLLHLAAILNRLTDK
jgi:hypothetical protein